MIDYTDIQTNLGISDESFEFEIPEGAEVLRYPPPEKKK